MKDVTKLEPVRMKDGIKPVHKEVEDPDHHKAEVVVTNGILLQHPKEEENGLKTHRERRHRRSETSQVLLEPASEDGEKIGNLGLSPTNHNLHTCKSEQELNMTSPEDVHVLCDSSVMRSRYGRIHKPKVAADFLTMNSHIEAILSPTTRKTNMKKGKNGEVPLDIEITNILRSHDPSAKVSVLKISSSPVQSLLKTPDTSGEVATLKSSDQHAGVFTLNNCSSTAEDSVLKKLDPPTKINTLMIADLSARDTTLKDSELPSGDAMLKMLEMLSGEDAVNEYDSLPDVDTLKTLDSPAVDATVKISGSPAKDVALKLDLHAEDTAEKLPDTTAGDSAGTPSDITVEDVTLKKPGMDVEISNTSYLDNPAKITITVSSKSDCERDYKPTQQVTVATEWILGDLVWAHMRGYPYWAAVVAEDASVGVFRRGRFGTTQIHVHFLGPDAEHGWVRESGLMEFKGVAQFHKGRCEVAASKRIGPNGKPISVAPFKVANTLRYKWDEAVRDAEHIGDFDREQRVAFCAEREASVPHWNNITSSSQKQSGRQKKQDGPKKYASWKTGGSQRKVSAQKQDSSQTPGNDLSEDVFQKQEGNLKLNGLVDTASVLGDASVEEREANSSNPTATSVDESSSKTSKRMRYLSPAGDGDTRGKDSIASKPAKRARRSLLTKAKIERAFQMYVEEQHNFFLEEHPETGSNEKEMVRHLRMDWDAMGEDLQMEYVAKDALRIAEAKGKEVATRRKRGWASGQRGRKQKYCSSDEDGEEWGSNGEEETKSRPKRMGRPPNRLGAGGSGGNKERKDDNVEGVNEEDSQEVEEASLFDEDESQHEEDDSQPESTFFLMKEGKSPWYCYVCQICEKLVRRNGELCRCKGECLNYFHRSCLEGIDGSEKDDFQCRECRTDSHLCFVCKKREGDAKPVRCSLRKCGRYYHEDCLSPSEWPQERPKRVCPLHVCHTCSVEDRGGKPTMRDVVKPIIRCVRCPTAYHADVHCLAAGSFPITPWHILCPKHIWEVEDGKRKSLTAHVNVSWCFRCSKGGSLICCERCPAAFHPGCLDIKLPEGSFFCEDCQAGKVYVHGDVVWVKLGNYRWWPARIRAPERIPDNIKALKHDVGEFAVEFFGSHDFYWVNHGRVFSYQDGDTGGTKSAAARRSSLESTFQRALVEAQEAHKEWEEQCLMWEAKMCCSTSDSTKPPRYIHIKTNRLVGNAKHPQDTTGIHASSSPCECKRDSESPCGEDSDCLNRMLLVECDPGVCPAKEKCCNQRFQKRLYPSLTPFRTMDRGWGLKTLVHINKGEFVIEYVGELVDEIEMHRRIGNMASTSREDYYFLLVDKDKILDAGPKGNMARFMNHSCDPNCETQKWTINGEVRVGLFAIKDVPAGSEVNFNYNLECVGEQKKRCLCRAANCSGFIGVKVKSKVLQKGVDSPAGGGGKGMMKKRGRRKIRRSLNKEKETEDECFRCGEGGSLFVCDLNACPKVYHLRCLGMTQPPPKKWICPWHMCDDCGKRSYFRCSYCPNSFCRKDSDGHIAEDKVLGWICHEHDQREREQLKLLRSEESIGDEDNNVSIDLDGRTQRLLGSVEVALVEGDGRLADESNEIFACEDGEQQAILVHIPSPDCSEGSEEEVDMVVEEEVIMMVKEEMDMVAEDGVEEVLVKVPPVPRRRPRRKSRSRKIF